MAKPIWLQRLLMRIEDRKERKKLIRNQLAKTLANIAKQRHKNEEEPWN